MRPILVVACKELVEATRDRRTIATMLLTSLFGPLMVAMMLRHEATIRTSADHVVLPVVGGNHAPMLVDWLTHQRGVEVVGDIVDPEAAVRSGRVEVALLIDDDFDASMAQSRPAKLRLLSDDTRPASSASAGRVARLLSGYGSTVATLRLVVRGISPEIASPLDVKQQNIATSEERSATALNVVLLFLSLAVLTAGMHIATDATAGERERGSLESLLLNPVARWQMIAGKWLAAVVWASAGLVFALIAIAAILSRLPLDLLDIRLHLDATTGLLLLAAMAPLAILAPAIQTYLGCFAKSFKEAQSYSVVLILPVTGLGVASIVAHVATGTWMQAVPILAQYAIGSRVLEGRVPWAITFITAGAEGMLVAGVFLALAARLLGSERMIVQS